MRKWLTVVALICLAQAAQANAETAPDPLADAVFERIGERLALMKAVAAWKQEHGVAVEDRAREAVVLENATEQAAKAGLAAETAQPFFEAQIEAAKDIQRCWLSRWDAGAPLLDSPANLETEIRPKLLELGVVLLTDVKAALAAGVVFDQTRVAAFTAATDLDCLSSAAREAIYRQLSGLRLADR
jgi:chorismate mutase